MHDSGLCIDQLADVTGRLTSLYRAMPESKLRRRLADGRSWAQAGHDLSALLARTAQGVEEHASPTEPVWRTLPDAGPFSVGDQIAVTGRDLVTALSATPPSRHGSGTTGDALVWTRSPAVSARRIPAAEAVTVALAAATDLLASLR